jgi:predicted enzyme related to lactoylglutathione lyase
MVHVPDWRTGLAWYARVFPEGVLSEEAGFGRIMVRGVAIEIVPADDKVPAGAAGSIIYWRVDELNGALARFLTAGAVLYRGPMAIGAGQAMCQVKDPWGNCVGLRGEL